MAATRRASADGSSSNTRSRGRFSSTVRVARPVCVCIRAGGEVEGVGDRRADAGDVEDADPVGVRRQQADEPRLAAARRVGDGDHRLAIGAEDPRRVVGAGDGDGAVGGHRARADARGRRRGRGRARCRGAASGSRRRRRRTRRSRGTRTGRRRATGAAGRRRRAPPSGRASPSKSSTTRRTSSSAARISASSSAAVASSVRSISNCVHASSRPRAGTGRVRGDVDEPVIGVAADREHRVDEQVHAEAPALEHHAASCRRGRACRR